MQIIKVTNNKIGEEKLQTVNSRELWEELGSQDKYSNWIKYQIETLDLEEKLDFEVIRKNPKNLQQGGRPEFDYIITLDAAKHIAMSSRSSKGKEVRKYFIEMEKYAIHILQEKAIDGNVLNYVREQQHYIERRQEATLETISDFSELNEKVVGALKNLLNTELDGLLVLNKALVDSIEEPTIQKMYISITKSIEDKRDFLWKVISNQVEETNKHNSQIHQFSETKLKELKKDLQTIIERKNAI